MVDDDILEANVNGGHGETLAHLFQGVPTREAYNPILSHAAFDGAALAACRQWLRQLQTFVMALQRDVDAFAIEAATRSRRASSAAAAVSLPDTDPPSTSVASSSSSSASRRHAALLAATLDHQEVLGLPSLTSWPDFLTNVSLQFDSAVEDLDAIEQEVRMYVFLREGGQISHWINRSMMHHA